MSSKVLAGTTLFAALAFFAGGQASNASTATVSTYGDFLADTTDQVTTGFNGVSPLSNGTCPQCYGSFTPSLVVNGITFTPNTTYVNVDSPGYYGSGDLTNAYLVNAYTPVSGGGPSNLILTITLPTAVTAFGLDFSTLFSATTATFTLSNGFTTNVATGTYNSGTGTLGTQFLGFLSSTPFDSIAFSVPNGVDGNDNTISYVVEDVTTAATPLPAALPLFAGGLGMIGMIAKRRKRKNNPGLAAA
jgi:hypothetical protein